MYVKIMCRNTSIQLFIYFSQAHTKIRLNMLE